MLWERATHWGGFLGLLAGTLASIGMFIWVYRIPGALRYIAMSTDAKPMAENLYRALWSWIICVVVTVVVSLVTKPVPNEQLSGLVYGVTPIPHDGAKTIWQKPIFWAIVVIVVFFILNLIFW
jgi:SSS family solute:Na+ symporter